MEYVDSLSVEREMAEGEELYVSCSYHEMAKKWLDEFKPYELPGWRFVGLDLRDGLVYVLSPEAAAKLHEGPK